MQVLWYEQLQQLLPAHPEPFKRVLARFCDLGGDINM